MNQFLPDRGSWRYRRFGFGQPFRGGSALGIKVRPPKNKRARTANQLGRLKTIEREQARVIPFHQKNAVQVHGGEHVYAGLPSAEARGLPPHLTRIARGRSPRAPLDHTMQAGSVLLRRLLTKVDQHSTGVDNSANCLMRRISQLLELAPRLVTRGTVRSPTLSSLVGHDTAPAAEGVRQPEHGGIN